MVYYSIHCKEKPIYVFPEKELRRLSLNFLIYMSVSDLYIPRISPHIFLQQNRQGRSWEYINCSQTHTAKTKCRKFETNFPRKGISGPQSQFPHSCVCEWFIYIPTIGLPVLLEEICRLILGIYKSLKDTWMWKLGLRPRYSQKRNT